MLKRILTLCLVLCMVALPAFAFDDIAGEKFEKEIELLGAIGIVEGNEEGLYKPGDFLTRAEMTTIDLRLLAVDASTPASFEDVPADHWASKVIGTAEQLGIVNGMSPTTFAPGENVTFPQAAKMLVCTLGYGVEAEALGGYPTGYLAKASQLGVTSGVKDDGGPLTRAAMAKMVANSLEVDLFVREGYGSDASYVTKEGVNLLNEYLGITVISDTVNANYTLKLGNNSCEEGEAIVGETIVEVGDTNLSSFIGRAVNVYAKVNEDEETFTALHVEAKKNSEYFTVKAEDILPDTTVNELCYETESGEATFDIEGAALYINGEKDTLTLDNVKIANGTLSIASANGKKADYIFVSRHEDFVVEKVSTASSLVTLKKGTALKLDPKDASKKISIKNAAGEEVALKDLKEWDVLSVTANSSKTVYDIVCHTESVTGKITEYSSKEGTVVINGKTYDIAPSVVGLVDGESFTGKEATFYLSYLGTIVAADTDGVEKDFKYGYIINYAKGQGIGAKESVKIFTEDGEMKVFTLDEKYKIINADTTETPLSFDGGSLSAEMLLKYSVDKDGEIYEFETLEAPKTGLGNFIGASRSFQNGGYILPDNTKIFKVPPVYTGEDAFYSITLGSAAAHWSSPMNFAYDINEDMQIGVGLSKKENADLAETISVVDKVSKVDDDGKTITRIRLMNGNIIDFDPSISKIQYQMTAFTSEKDVPNRLDRQYGGGTSTSWTDPSNTIIFEDAEGNALSADALDQGDVIFYATPDQSGVTGMIKIILRASHAPYMPTYAEANAEQGVTQEMYDQTPFYANNSMGFDDDGKGYMSFASYNQYSLYYIDHMDTLTNKVISFRTIGYSIVKRAPWFVDFWGVDSGGSTGGTTYVEPANNTINLEKVRSCYMFDMEKGTIVQSSVAEITEEDKVFVHVTNGTPVLLVIYRNMPAQSAPVTE